MSWAKTTLFTRQCPCELLNHTLCWDGPSWLKSWPSQWPKNILLSIMTQEGEELSTTTCPLPVIEDTLIPEDKLLSINQYRWFIAWVIRFIHNCKESVWAKQPKTGALITKELNLAANHRYSVIQRMHISVDLRNLAKGSLKTSKSSNTYSLNSLGNDQGILRVDGRQQKARFTYNSRHLVILDSRHHFTKLVSTFEHVCFPHGGALLVSSSSFRNIHILDGYRAISSVVWSCVICRCWMPKTQPQMMGLPPECITPDIVFEHVDLDLAGPLWLVT